MTKKTSAEGIKDRIVDFRRVKGSDLIANDKNWRKHPERQRKAMEAVLGSIGFVDALLARETPDGLVLIDGHLRKDLTPDQEVPVLVVDLTEDEANTVLATFDPISGMADSDNSLLGELLDGLRATDIDIGPVLDMIGSDHGITPPDFAPGSEDDQGKLDQLDPKMVTCPHCETEFDLRNV